MKCSFCGKELNEGVKFCSFCGTRIKTVAPQDPTEERIAQEKVEPTPNGTPDVSTPEESGTVSNTDLSETAPVAEERPEEKKGGKKKLTVIVAAVLAAIIFVSAAIIGLSRAFEADGEYLPVAISAYVSGNGDGYVCYGNGKTLHIGSDVDEAVMTADRKRVVVLAKTGTIYWKNVKNGEQTNIYNASEGESKLISVCNNMVIYAVSTTQIKQVQDPNRGMIVDHEEERVTYYSYSFREDAMYVLGSEDELDAIAVSMTSQLSCGVGAVAYAKDGTVYTYGGTTPMSVDRYDDGNDSVEILSVSPDGGAVVWGVQNSSYTTKIYLSTGTSRHMLDSFGSGEAVSSAYEMNCPISSSDQLVVVCSDKVYIKNGDDFNSVTLPDAVASPYAYGTDGKMISVSKSFIVTSGFFVLTQNGDAFDLYMIKADGERNRIVSDIDDFAIADGMLAFERDGKLSVAEFNAKKGEIENTVSFPNASDISSVQAVGKYVYFTDGSGALYRYSVKKEETSCIYRDVDKFILSDDGKTVYFIIDAEAVSDGVTYGDLIRNTEKDGNERIDEDVLVSSVTSGLLGGVVEDGNVWYEKYATATDTGYKFHSVYFNGKKPRSVITNIHS